MNELKQIRWQQELLESKDNKILCNVGRGQGKNFAMWLEIIKSKPKNVICISKNSMSSAFTVALDKIEEIMDMRMSYDVNVTFKSYQNKYINLSVKENNEIHKIHIQFINSASIGSMININEAETLVVMQDCIQEKIFNEYDDFQKIIAFISDRDLPKSKEVLFDKVIKSGISDGLNEGLYNDIIFNNIMSEIYLLKEFDILNEGKPSFLMQTLKSLENEYSNIIPASNNIMSRKNILEMILGIKNELRLNK